MRPDRTRRLVTNVIVLLALIVVGRFTRGMDHDTQVGAFLGTVVLVFVASALWPRIKSSF